MAKQSGIHQLRGKFGGNVYYSQKGVSEGLVRKINEGMSSRVKNDAAFANTRLNAREFGMAGQSAGAATRAISQRWRTILNPFATGSFVKILLQAIRGDASHLWGERTIDMIGGAPLIFSTIPQYAKNQYSENFATGITYTSDEATGITIFGTTTAETSAGLSSRGAMGVIYEYYVYGLKKARFDDASQTYTPASSIVTFIGRKDSAIGEVTDLGLTNPLVKMPTQTDDFASCVMIVALPYKVVGNVKYTLQELCSFDMVYIPAQ